MIISPQVSYLN